MCAKKRDNSAAPERVVVLKSGRRLPLVGESTKYWLCEGTQFRKGGDQVERVEEVPAVDVPEAVDEPETEGAAEEREAADDGREEVEEDADC